MKFIKLTNINGHITYVNFDMVSSFGQTINFNKNGEYRDSIRSYVKMDDGHEHYIETV